MVLASPNPIRSEGILPSNELIPVVDLTAERSEVAKLIVKACEEYGFFKVINHGISHEVISKTEEAGFSFFEKPVAEKRVAAPAYGCKNIGLNGDMGEVEYLVLGATTHSIAQISKTVSTDPLNFSSTLSAYTEAVRELACEILELIAEGLGVPDTRAFSRFIRDVDSDSVLRLNHYPPIINKDKDMSQYSKVGFGEHSDPQIITILRSNDVGGLQISLQDGVWIPVTPDPSAFYVNVGDVLEVMTNGRFVSVRHRAMTNSYKCRMSVAYFGAPPLHATIVAPSVMVTPQRPSLFRPFTWADYKKATYSLRLGDTRIQLFTNRLTTNHHPKV
ncbi:gibberellin 2-beta-dioxygenase 2-like [Glycine soja]|uniref:gibberellin 2beta-dioxygenase n=1 Tax=Glycine soja TaxID=3848 RepID=A0A445K0S6_GLYSO|nr:gibberellin 2-beta-dioxygenase 2-like [Glycine soja]RZC04346.1 Gibberellin 2-beta-dioxygenase 2 [Glycine soja]